MATKKTANTTIVDRFKDTFVEQPVTVVNKTFLAGLGLAKQFQSGFEAKFNELAKDGAAVRNQAQKSADGLRDDVTSRFTTVRKDVGKRFESVVDTVLGYSPIATTDDVNKLNRKLDKVLAQVAK